MNKFDVRGMHCSACSARLEKVVSKVPGVSECNVNLLTNSMTVNGNASVDAILTAVENAGFEADEVKDGEKKSDDDDESAPIIKRLLSSTAFLVILAYFSMGVMLFNAPQPQSFYDKPIYNALIQLVSALAIMIINRYFFISGFSSIARKAPNMDSLVAIGSLSAFVWSIAMSVMIIMRPEKAEIYSMDLYYDSAGMILVLISVGKLLEAISKGKTTNALTSLVQLSPKEARVVRDGVEVVLPVADVKVGDIFLVKPGENIAADGEVIEGSSEVDESALTGESMPVSKSEKSNVFAATTNQSGFLKCVVTKTQSETAFAQILKIVEEATQSKAPIAKLADKVSAIFVPTVICVAILTFAVWIMIGQTLAFALARSISVLVISCPCALGLATPVAIMVGSGRGAKMGILFKNATALEVAGRVKTVLFDKTGTITQGAPALVDIVPAAGVSEEELLALAFALESKSEHPVARAIVDSVNSSFSNYAVSDFEALTGRGIKAKLNGKNSYAGSLFFLNTIVKIPDSLAKKAVALANEGKTVLAFSHDNKFYGIISVADKVREDSRKAISILKKMGLNIAMLTGDNEGTARFIANQVGIENCNAELLPNEKSAFVASIKNDFPLVAMVGDGINDAPALTSADLGIAIGAGSDIAIESAGVVLTKNGLSEVVHALSLGRATLKNIKENLFWAFIYNIIGIPIAAGAFAHFGLFLNPMIAAAAMSFSSFFVIANALRLNFVKLY